MENGINFIGDEFEAQFLGKFSIYKWKVPKISIAHIFNEGEIYPRNFLKFLLGTANYLSNFSKFFIIFHKVSEDFLKMCRKCYNKLKKIVS